ncbi:hypothetical protein HID58_002484 [Brassica napus]|uniref:Uncharacterized protein n=1 Tax=Brassica napus TaxID=3708 RepID=A0ABQ8ENG3_BRANA|nr:hypothetical protein HID58_002484 [Brassica napus]
MALLSPLSSFFSYFEP